MVIAALGLCREAHSKVQRLKGTVLPGGADWAIIRSDNVALLDVRLVLQTHDDAVIGMSHRGIRHGSAAVMERLNKDEPVDPSEYYFRTIATFETAASHYDWLNRRSRSVSVIVRQEPSSTNYLTPLAGGHRRARSPLCRGSRVETHRHPERNRSADTLFGLDVQSPT